MSHACTNKGTSGDTYIGTWKNNQNNQELIITIVGSNSYSLKLRVPYKPLGTMDEFTYSDITYKDGNLYRNDTKIVSYSNGKVIYKDEEYEKVNIEDKKSNKIEEKQFDLKKLLGHWKTLAGDKELYFFNNGNGIEFLGSGYPFGGKYYPNMEPGTKTEIRLQGDTYWLWHTTPNSGGAGYEIKYFPDKDHIYLHPNEYERSK